MLTIGLTGGIGSGKSTVAEWFAKKGVPVLDADKTVHYLLQSDSSTIASLVQEFGLSILDHSGQIDRLKLGERVFRDAKARKCLERIVHPRVQDCMQKERAALENGGAKLCVWDVPLLFETGFEQFVDEVWVVWVPRSLQVLRVLARDKLSPGEVEDRLAAQGSLDEKRSRADVVIDNSGSESETQQRLKAAWQGLLLRQHIRDFDSEELP